MASHFVKWCKAKFLDGYKHMSVLPSEGISSKASDTEELLTKEYARSADKFSINDVSWDETDLASAPRIPEKQRELNFDEFECDVSIGGGGNLSNERQEFSFTLYDFNGHGKITQDDIAGLVKTIYDAVGTSVKVPQGGSKTIKVKLTVSPDKREAKDDTTEQNEEDVNITIQESSTIQNNTTTASPHEKLIENVGNAFNSLLKDKEINKNICNLALPDGMNSRKCQSLHQQHPHHPAYRSSSLSPDGQHKECSVSPKQNRKNCKEQLCRQELLKIIKSNMEKNHLAPNRPDCSDHVPSMDPYHHKHLHELWKDDECSCHKCCQQQDLEEMEHLLPKQSEHNHHHHPCKCKVVDGCGGCSKHSKACDHNHCPKAHSRSRPQDLGCGSAAGVHPFKYHHLLEQEQHKQLSDKCHGHCHQVRTHSHDIYGNLQSPKVHHQHVHPRHSSSPHYQRHRNREHDRARAMAQVISWLERDYPSHDKTRYHEDTHKPRLDGQRGTKNHEQHHVHEHIHHHYHHYQEAPADTV